ncbi:MAG TPA: aspartyl protease family protein [Steroidobacteraceae bacterium]
MNESFAPPRQGRGWLIAALLAVGALLMCPALSRSDELAEPTLATAPQPSPSLPVDELPQIQISAPEPRYVAPTRRDRIGRIWAPVLINGQGPFRLVLDTGASHSGVNAQVAQALGIPPDQSAPVMLQGVTGSAVVPTIRVDSLTVGDLTLRPVILPIIKDALGGADGILGTEGMTDKRIYIDFKHDLITINRSHNDSGDRDFVTIPVMRSPQGLLMFKAYVGGIRVKAILDTGAQCTIGNWAMRDALLRRHKSQPQIEQVIGVTNDEQDGESYTTPPIEFDTIRIMGAQVTYGDMHIFEHWKLTKEPVLLIGMDAIGLLDTVIIDYRRHELQIRMRD